MLKVLIFLPTPDLSVQGTSSSSVVPALNSPNNGEQNVFIIYNTFATCNHFILYNLFVFFKSSIKAVTGASTCMSLRICRFSWTDL